jgi:hypothetical protein
MCTQGVPLKVPLAVPVTVPGKLKCVPGKSKGVPGKLKGVPGKLTQGFALSDWKTNMWLVTQDSLSVTQKDLPVTTKHLRVTHKSSKNNLLDTQKQHPKTTITNGQQKLAPYDLACLITGHISQPARVHAIKPDNAQTNEQIWRLASHSTCQSTTPLANEPARQQTMWQTK